MERGTLLTDFDLLLLRDRLLDLVEFLSRINDNLLPLSRLSWSRGLGDLIVGDQILDDLILSDPNLGDSILGDLIFGDLIVGDPILGDLMILGDLILDESILGHPIFGDLILDELILGDPILGDLTTGDSILVLLGDLIIDDPILGDLIFGDQILNDSFLADLFLGDSLLGGRIFRDIIFVCEHCSDDERLWFELIWRDLAGCSLHILLINLDLIVITLGRNFSFDDSFEYKFFIFFDCVFMSKDKRSERKYTF